MDSYIGKMLDGRYEIIERIGTGGMAVVYKAKCHRLNRLVAIKILKNDLAQDADFRRRFHTESQAVALLSHANIVSVYDVSRGNDLDYIVMEMIDGITLKQYMERKGALNWRESLHFITQIFRGLDHAHDRGIVHRDIKPQNIMVLRDGSVKVTDFGIACMEDTSQTLTQQTFGSVHYISPEQAKGDRPDARSDIYSAGVMFYEMLCNRLPFEGDSAVSIALQHVSSIPLSPREINPEVPQALELICLKAMAPVLGKRYQSAQAAIDELEAFRKNPDMTVDIKVADLHAVQVDEPTVIIPTPEVKAAEKAAEKLAKKRAVVEEDDYDDQDYENNNRGRIARVLFMLAILVAVIFGLVALFKSIFASFVAPVPEYTVPDLQGMTIEEAMELEDVFDIFEIIEKTTVVSDDFEAGQIVTQEPVADTVKKSDLVIYVTVSQGEGTILMPDVIGQNYRMAELQMKDVIAEKNLTIETELVFSDSVPEEDIVSTLPAVSGVLNDGDIVTFYVSQGPEIATTTVPSFIGKDIETVRQEVETTWKLTMGTPSYIEDDAPSGQVIQQSIAVATEVNEGTTIDFVVSSGPAAPTEQTITINPKLPTTVERVKLLVTLDDIPVYNQEVDTSLGSVAVSLTGSGTGRVTVYWDGVQHEEYTVQFT